MSTLFQELAKELAQADKFKSPLHVMEAIDPRAVRTPALELINEALLKAMNTKNSRLIITMPPGEGKSSILNAAAAYKLYHNRNARIITASYGQDLADKSGLAVKDAMKELGLKISRESSSKSAWSLEEKDKTIKGVSFYGTTVGGSLTGFHGELFIIDDPVKGEKMAKSKIEQNAIVSWYQTTFSTRLVKGASAILIMTRWEDSDLAGFLIDSEEEWEVLNIPAQCVDEANDPLGRKLGEFMESVHDYSDADWERKKKAVGSRGWNALYQGDPVPDEGNIVNPEWFREYNSNQAPTRSEGEWLMSWDLAFSGTKTSDYVVGQVWCRRNGEYYLIDQVRGQWNFPKTIEQFKLLSARYPWVSRKLVEAKANGTALIDSLREANVSGLIPINPRDSKEQRFHAISPDIEGGSVYLPRNAGFSTDIITEAARFPYGKNDDCVDAMTQALSYYKTSMKKRKSFPGGIYGI